MLRYFSSWAGLFTLLLLAALPGWSQVSVLTQHNDNLRTGANLNETTLTTSNVNSSTFGQLFSCPVDGFIYAQPLYVPNAAIAGGTHNVLYVATAHDSVYAFDADTGVQYWKTSLGTPVPSTVINTPNMLVEVGITSTPVIDPISGTIYVAAKTYENGTQILRLHALDLITGAEKLAGPTTITAQVSGTGDGVDGTGHITFDASKENPRPGLTLVNGVIYAAFASHEDYDPYHGWVLAYNASTLQQVAAFNTTPNGGRGGIWMGGQGMVTDSANNIYLLTGNSSQSGENSAADYGESFLKLALSGSSLTVSDYFKPNNYDSLNASDADLGSGGALAIPGTTYLVGGGKQGLLYLVNTANMGGLNTSSDQVAQEFQADNGLWGSPVFWNSATPTLYVWGVSDQLKAYAYSNGLFTTTPASVSTVSTPGGGDPCGALSISSNGNVAGTGIVWATAPQADPDHATVGGALYAFDATNVASKLWDSTQTAGDSIGNFAKFCAPTVANGKVYVATDSGQVCVFGLLLPVPPVAPTNLTATAGNTLAALSWTAAPHATDYNVKRADQSGGPYITVATAVPTTNYVDRNLTNGATYYYVVSAHNAFGESVANSNAASVTPSASAQGTIISLSFVGNAPTPMAATESAGVVPALNWNNGTGSQNSISALLDNLSLPTGSTAAWTSNGPWATGIADTAGNYRMMKGYLDTSTTSVTTVTVSNLPTSFTTNGYDVYVYADGDNGGATRTGSYTIAGATLTATDSAGTDFSGPFTQAANSAGNYLEFSSVGGTGFTLTATPGAASDGTARAPVNAIQIVAHPPVAPPITAHLLWNNASGQASLWKLHADGSYLYNLYGPFSGWSGEALSNGPDGTPHILWTDTSGQASFWNVGSGSSFTDNEYGPFSGWGASALSTGGDGVSHLLWNQTSGQASLWNLDSAGGFTHAEYGPFPNWTARSLGAGSDGIVHLLWTNASGQISLWNMNADGSFTHQEFGPYTGWTAKALTVGPDNIQHLLWIHASDNEASLWNYDPAQGSFTDTEYGPFAGWTASCLCVGSDNQIQVLWNHASDGQVSLWNLGTAGSYTHTEFGPFAGWNAVALTAGP